ncbi:hypothetical protein [Thiomicrorhabdus aquaedulcis]|uniref:hypothetical protein n=1 Tax=Thiomicrorhabdus aquaedulcis TaxID=2211106 RepID=UPI000FDC5EFB|nr:hypothetical protein [Thiomicrorhabdus aquaedulcis]
MDVRLRVPGSSKKITSEGWNWLDALKEADEHGFDSLSEKKLLIILSMSSLLIPELEQKDEDMVSRLIQDGTSVEEAVKVVFQKQQVIHESKLISEAVRKVLSSRA